jgi:peptide/nickel transport system permease protein
MAYIALSTQGYAESQAMFNLSLAARTLLGWLLLALLASAIPASSPDLSYILQSPNIDAWFGYDDVGREILPRLLKGAQVSLSVAVLVSLLSATIGISFGCVAGYCGGVIDHLLMRVTDVVLAFPGILLALAFAAVLGPGLGNVILALSLTAWVTYARLTRVQVQAVKQQQHVLAARSLGASHLRIVGRHILPLLSAPLLVEATYSMASLVIAEASLSFLGLGVQVPNPSWGAMLRDAVRYMLVAPHYLLAVGLSLISLVLAVNVLGDELRRYWDVRGKL